MTYTIEELESLMTRACEKLMAEQPMLFNKQANINERTFAGELKEKISDYFDGFHTSAEYNRMTDENGIQLPKRIQLNPFDPEPSSVFPDIIVHRQEDGEHNILIMEIKMSWKNGKKADDLNKLKRYIKELRYENGLYLEIGEKGITQMQWFH